MTHRYNLGDTVYHWWVSRAKVYHACSICTGSGWVSAAGTDQRALCPISECRNGKIVGDADVETYTITGPLTVGKVAVTVSRKKHPDDDGMFDNCIDTELFLIERKVEYMAHESGIGSGRILYEHNLEPSYAEAVAAAEAAGAVASAEVVA